MPTTATVEIDAGPVRVAGAAMLGVAAVRPLLGNPGIPCPLRTLTGVPCPFCGMTRGVIDTVHGHLGHALLMNPGSVMLVAAAIVLLAAWRRHRLIFPVWLPYVALAGLWSFQLFKLATGRPL